MNTIDSLTIRTTTALARLTSLQRRADKLTGGAPSVVRDALHELGSALEELQAANDQLTEQVEQLATARMTTDEGNRRLEAVFVLMPIPCVFTDADGRITDANPQASTLLNVGRTHLSGKSLFLFFMERDAFIEATSSKLEQFERSIVVRPRERRPRPMIVRGHRLDDAGRWCWFLAPPPGESESGGPVEFA